MKKANKPTREEFVVEVRAEIEHIKKKAKLAELKRLNINHFCYASPTNCIYGQMTGNCTSERAKQLYPKKYNDTGTCVNGRIPFSRHTFGLLDNTQRSGSGFTPLEKYLYMAKRKTNENIISYLKGDINELVLE